MIRTVRTGFKPSKVALNARPGVCDRRGFICGVSAVMTLGKMNVIRIRFRVADNQSSVGGPVSKQ